MGLVTIVCLKCGAPVVTYNENRRFCNRRCRSGFLKKSLAQRYWEKVVVGDGCWGWTAATAIFGYGIMCHEDKMCSAHRISWELHNGPIPPGMQVLHHCDNPPCSNPAHLFLGTNMDNQRDSMAKGRHIIGERQGRSRLIAAQVIEILKLRASGLSQFEIARRFGVSRGAIQAIVERRNWRHVEVPA